MISGKEIRRDTQLIVLSVLVLTIVTLSVSYSAFFSVQTQSTIQELKAGDLSVVIDVNNSMKDGELYPTENKELPISEESVADGERYTTLTLKNEGNLPADFSVTISYDLEALKAKGKRQEDLLDFDYLNIGIYDDDNNKWIPFGKDSNTFSTSISSLTPSEEGIDVYPILRDVIETKNDEGFNGQRVFKIYVWLDEETPTDEIGKLVYLKLDVKSATVEGRLTEDEYTDPSIKS